MKRRILFVTTSTALGGAEKTLFLLATGLPQASCETAGVVSLKTSGPYAARLSAAGVRVESFGLGRFPEPWQAWRLARLIDEIQPDIVHAFLYSAIQLSRVAKKLSLHRFRLVTSPRAHFRFRGPAARGLDRLLKGADDLLVSECEASRRYLIDAMGYEPGRVVTVLNGVEAERYTPDPGARLELREKLGLTPKQLLIGTVGRLDPQKGQQYLIDAAQSLLADHPDLRLAIVGDGPLRSALSESLLRQGLSDRFCLAGEAADVRPWLWAMDIFVLPSLFEGLPNALLEAMASGLPVISTAVDGSAEVLEDGKTGLLVAPGSSAPLADALRRLVEDRALRARLAQAGREEIARRFTLGRMLSDYEKVYLDVGARP